MCAVSAVSNHYMQQWQPNPLMPRQIPDNETMIALREIVRRLDEIDKKLGEKDCMDDQKKEFFAAIGYTDGQST